MNHYEPLSTTNRQLRPLAEYTTRIPSSRRGKSLNRATLWRWALRGVRGRTLRTTEIGGSRYTCDAWVAEFAQEIRPRPGAPRPIDASTRAELDAIEARLQSPRRERSA